jgi:hypothetical protein
MERTSCDYNHPRIGGQADLARLVYTFDPTDVDDVQIPIGKQTLNRDGTIWYTPCSGIWQTVWLESTTKEHISKLDLTADMDGMGKYEVYTFTGHC